MAVLETASLTKSYGRVVALRSLDLRLEEGSILGFLGPNGAGKTTAIRVLLGFLRATSGSASIFGLDCWRDAAIIKRDVGYLPGDLRLWGGYTGRAAIRLFGKIRGTDIRSRAIDLAERYDLDLGLRVDRMSRGTRQKLGLVLALAHEPRLVVLDEPTTALDPVMQRLLEEDLRAVSRSGRSVFFSSHTLPEVERLCDRVAILRAGELVESSSVDDLRRRAQREVEISWNEGAGVGHGDPPESVEVLERSRERWRCVIEGPAGPLVAWLAGRPVRDVSIAPPDLESLFRRYYSG